MNLHPNKLTYVFCDFSPSSHCNPHRGSYERRLQRKGVLLDPKKQNRHVPRYPPVPASWFSMLNGCNIIGHYTLEYLIWDDTWKNGRFSIYPLSQGRGTVFYPTLQLLSSMMFKQQRLDMNIMKGEVADLWILCLSKVSSNGLPPRYVINNIETEITRTSRVCKAVIWDFIYRPG